MHVHVTSEHGEAKFWIEPIVSLAVYHGLNSRKLTEIQKIVEARKDEINKLPRRKQRGIENINKMHYAASGGEFNPKLRLNIH